MNFKIVFILITILVTTQTATAETPLNLTDTIPHLIALGFDEILISLGDSVYSLAGANNSGQMNLYMT